MATSAAGLAALALFVLVLGYWVPLRVRQRQELAEARVEDRFSTGLRVLAVAARGPVPAESLDGVPAATGQLTAGPAVAGLLTTGPLTAGAEPVVHGAGLLAMAAAPGPAAPRPAAPRPAATGAGSGSAREETPMAPPQTAARSSRRALLEARAKRARRRAAVTLVLFLATVAAWAAVPFTTLLWYGALVPTVLLAGVLALGRAAASAAHRSDLRWAAEQRAAERRALHARALAAGGPHAPMNRVRVTGRAVRGSSTMTQMIPRVEATARAGAGATAVPEGPDGAADGSHTRTAVEGLGAGGVADGPDAGAIVDGSGAQRALGGRDASHPRPAGPDEAPPSRGETVSRAASTADVVAPSSQAPDDVVASAQAPVHVSVPTAGTPWEPRPVPLPTYVTKPAAPRREPRPLTGDTPAVSTGWSSSPWQRADDAGEQVGEANTSWSLGVTQAAALGPTATSAPVPTSSVDPVATPEPRPKTETLGLPLEQILARRRAAG